MKIIGGDLCFVEALAHVAAFFGRRMKVHERVLITGAERLLGRYFTAQLAGRAGDYGGAHQDALDQLAS